MRKSKIMSRKPFSVLVGIMAASMAFAAGPSPEQIQIADQVESINQQADIAIQKNTHPQNASINVVLAINEKAGFLPKNLVLVLDGKEVAKLAYDKKAFDAFMIGGYQSVLLKKIAAGSHTISANIEGENSRQKPLQYSADLSFSGTGKTLILQVNKPDKVTPAFMVKEWSAP